MKHLPLLFSKILGMDASFYLTEDDYAAQRFLYAGIEQLKELSEMKKAGAYDFETVVLIEEKPNTVVLIEEKSKNIFSRDVGAAIGGLILVEREKAEKPNENDTGTCLVFTPAVSDKETKIIFAELMNTMLPIENASSETPVYQLEISAAELADDIRKYYADAAKSAFEESNKKLSYESVYSQSRAEKALLTLQMAGEIFEDLDVGRPFLSKDISVLEICCGNGMSTLALHEKGIEPLCIDINAEDVCTGLSHSVLKPEKTIIADASVLSRLIDGEQFDTVIGFMVGTVYEFNKNLWFSIADEAVKMLKSGGCLLLTLREKHEADWIAEYLKTSGIDGKVIDNRDAETNYDSWIYAARQ